MFNKKIAEKMICIASAIFILGLFSIINKDLSSSEGFLIIFIIILMLSRYSGKKELKDLSVKYQNSQELLSDIFKYCPDAIFLKDCDSKYIYCNDIFCKIIGFRFEDIINKTDSVFLEQELAKRALINDQLIIKNKETTNYDLNYVTPDGECKIFNIIKAPLINNGQVTGVLGIARDATFQRNLKTSLEEKQSQINAILENMPFCAYVKDLQGNFLSGNSKVFELSGKTKQELVGTNLSEIFPAELLPQIAAEDKKIIENKETLRIEMQCFFDSTETWLEINKSPILNNDGEVIGIVVVFRDIACMKEIEAQKETFVATLTHDLKVPTIAQIKALELLLKGTMGQFNENQSEALVQIMNSCRYMLNMISTLLSTYRYDDGIKKMNYEEFNFIDLVSECCNEIACLAKEKEQKLLIKNNSTDNLIQADKLEIKRVITNLISNAIYYSSKNSQIEIIMEDASNEITLLVTSHSRVIPTEKLEKLFDKYVSSGIKPQQSGLGLYLVKQIIDIHNGEVIAESDEINGNTFGFKIPKTKLKDLSTEEFSNSSNTP